MRTMLLAVLGALAPALMAIPPFQYLPNLQVDETSAGAVTATLVDNDVADFGRVFAPTQPGAQSAWLTIRVTSAAGPWNSGDLNMTAPAFTSGGGAFALDTSGFATFVAVGNSTSFTVAFAPQTAGTFTGTIMFQWEEDPYGNPGVMVDFRINVEGSTVTGPASYLAVHVASGTGPRVYDNQPAVNLRDFGRRKNDAGPAPALSLWLYNEGGTGAPALNLGTPTFSPISNEFGVNLSAFSATLAPGVGTEITVTFDPLFAGTYTGTLTFTQDDGVNASPFHVLFTGEGMDEAAQIRVCDDAGPFFQNQANPPATYIGTHLAENAAAGGNSNLGQVTSGSVTITICNADVGIFTFWYEPGADLSLGTPAVVGDADFTLDLTGYSGLVASAGTTSFVVNFNAQANGSRSATIEIPHGDTTERAPFRVQVTADGVVIGGPGPGPGGGSGGTSGGGGCIVEPSSSAWLTLVAFLVMLAAPRLARRQR
jgi:hypothetical protein